MEAYQIRQLEREIESLESRIAVSQQIASCPGAIKEPHHRSSVEQTIRDLQAQLLKARSQLPQAPEVRTVFIIPQSSQPQSQPAPRRIPHWVNRAF